MNNKVIAILTFVSITSVICMSQKKTAKVTYEFPAEMAPDIKKEYIKLCNKGKILYDINCARCHNAVVNNREEIPDFSPEQIKGYEIRISNAQHESSMPDTLVTAEELSLISTFLTYKKKNNVPVK